MSKGERRGQFIVFEGLDGSGKTTQAALLEKYLRNEEADVLLTREPTMESEAGKRIEQVLAEKMVIEPLELQKLFVEDRREHVECVILPALQVRRIVVSDRYFFSTIAYGSLGCDVEELIRLNQEFPYPDLTFLISVSPEECVRRMAFRGEDLKLFEKIEKLGKVAEVYRALSRRFADVHVIDGERPRDEIFEDVLRIVRPSSA